MTEILAALAIVGAFQRPAGIFFKNLLIKVLVWLSERLYYLSPYTGAIALTFMWLTSPIPLVR